MLGFKAGAFFAHFSLTTDKVDRLHGRAEHSGKLCQLCRALSRFSLFSKFPPLCGIVPTGNFKGKPQPFLQLRGCDSLSFI